MLGRPLYPVLENAIVEPYHPACRTRQQNSAPITPHSELAVYRDLNNLNLWLVPRGQGAAGVLRFGGGGRR